MTTIITSHYYMTFGYAKLLAIPRRDVFHRSRAQRSSSRSHGRVRVVGAVTTTMYLPVRRPTQQLLNGDGHLRFILSHVYTIILSPEAVSTIVIIVTGRR